MPRTACLPRCFTPVLLAMLMLGAARAAAPPQPSAIDFDMIRTYAVLADAAYDTQQGIKDRLADTDYRLDHYGIIPDAGSAWFLISLPGPHTRIIAIRGTANINNTLVNLELKLVADPRTDIRLHSGFARAARAVYGELVPHIKKDDRIIITGHSLGGAVAMILALYLEMDGFDLERVVTFGQPKVTNLSGSAKFDRLDITRVVTPGDIVPLIPPLDAVDINDLDIYWHSGREIILMEGERYAMLEGLDSMLRATRFTQRQPDADNLKQHQMEHYLRLLDDKTSNAKRVPLKNNLNLFNLLGKDPE